MLAVQNTISFFEQINFFLLYKLKNKYLKKAPMYFFDKVHTGNVLFLKFLIYEFRSVRKYFFLGLCVGVRKNNINSSITIKNALGGILIEQKFLVFNNLLILCRNSKKRFVVLGLKKSKLFFLYNIPFFFRLNKAAVADTIFYNNNNKKRFKKKLSGLK